MAETSTKSSRSLPSVEEATGWTGHRIDEIGGSSVARVTGVYVDQEEGEPVWVIAKLGRFGKVIAIPFRDCAPGAGHIWVPFSRDALRGAPVVDPAKPLTREQELAICEHYGIREGQGRAGDVGDRPDGAVTAQAPSAGA